MISKAQIKLITSLKIKKYRQKYNLFFGEGKKIAKELLNAPLEKHAIFATKEWINDNVIGLQKYKKIIYEITENELKKISSLTAPNHVVVVAEIPHHKLPPACIKKSLSLALDDISDPGNVGTIIRIADWFNFPYIFCGLNCADAYNPKVVQATMGSIARVKIVYGKLDELFEEYKDLPVYGTTIKGKSIFKVNLKKKGFILIGNESSGIGPNLVSYITQEIGIPKYGSADSLNAAIATAIICTEFRKNN